MQAGEFFGYGVDSGTGCFASAEAVAVLVPAISMRTLTRSRTGCSRRRRHRLEAFGRCRRRSGQRANVIGFTSGFGDGGYPSWFGLDADGEPLVLLTDFGILEVPGP